jgi:hypothetical protein
MHGRLNVTYENAWHLSTHKYQILCLPTEITNRDINHVLEGVWWQSNEKCLRFMTSIKASILDARVLTMTLVVVSISVNKWLKCACVRDREKWQMEICVPNYIRGWNLCRIFMMCLTWAAFVSSWYHECWRPNKKEYEIAFPVTSLIWPLKKNWWTT